MTFKYLLAFNLVASFHETTGGCIRIGSQCTSEIQISKVKQWGNTWWGRWINDSCGDQWLLSECTNTFTWWCSMSYSTELIFQPRVVNHFCKMLPWFSILVTANKDSCCCFISSLFEFMAVQKGKRYNWCIEIITFKWFVKVIN